MTQEHNAARPPKSCRASSMANPTARTRHLLYALPLLVLTLACCTLMWCSLPMQAPARLVCTLLLGVNITVLSSSVWTSIMGAWAARQAGQSSGMASPRAGGQTATAVVMPIHKEDPARVFAAMEAMRDSLDAQGVDLGRVEFWVLSDTPPGEVADAELAAWSRLAHHSGGQAHHAASPIHYRRRAAPTRRKVGNLEEFAARWGAGFDYMLVLDADSTMTGQAMARLIGLMDANPGAGIIQAMCYPVGRDTAFARLQQFGAHLGGHYLAHGAAFLSGPRGGYWGHNAIVRIPAFAASCGLPDLPGKGVFGGEILCHDTIEAALMARAGWGVFVDTGCGGSWEEAPTNLVDSLVRERRWCQGNLQHTPILAAHGLHPLSRWNIALGILHYVNAPIFLAGIILAAVLSDTAPAATSAWPGVALALVVAALLLGTRLMSLARALVNPAIRRGYGGAGRLVLGALCEQVAGVLLAPPAMVFQSIFVFSVLMGRGVDWAPQVRSERGLDWGEACRALLPATLPAALATAGLFACTGSLAAIALLPGLVMCVPLAVLSSRPARRRAASQARGAKAALWSVAEDLEASPVRLRVLQRQHELMAGVWATSSPLPALPASSPLVMVPQSFRAPPRWATSGARTIPVADASMPAPAPDDAGLASVQAPLQPVSA